MLAAVLQNGFALKHASQNLQMDRQLMRAATPKCRRVLTDVPGLDQPDNQANFSVQKISDGVQQSSPDFEMEEEDTASFAEGTVGLELSAMSEVGCVAAEPFSDSPEVDAVVEDPISADETCNSFLGPAEPLAFPLIAADCDAKAVPVASEGLPDEGLTCSEDPTSQTAATEAQPVAGEPPEEEAEPEAQAQMSEELVEAQVDSELAEASDGEQSLPSHTPYLELASDAPCQEIACNEGQNQDLPALSHENSEFTDEVVLATAQQAHPTPPADGNPRAPMMGFALQSCCFGFLSSLRQ